MSCFMMFKYRQTIFHKEKMFILFFLNKEKEHGYVNALLSQISRECNCVKKSGSFHPKETSCGVHN